MFAGSFEATLHSFYTVLIGTCVCHQVMRVGTRHYVSRTVLDVPTNATTTDSTSLLKFNVTSRFAADAPTCV
jgi:hypothetical protein